MKNLFLFACLLTCTLAAHAQYDSTVTIIDSTDYDFPQKWQRLYANVPTDSANTGYFIDKVVWLNNHPARFNGIIAQTDSGYTSTDTVYFHPEPGASAVIRLIDGFTVNNQYGGIPGLKYATPRSVRLGDTADVMFIFKYVDLTEWQNVHLTFALHIGLTDATPQIKVLAYSVVNDTTLTARLFVNPNCHMGGHTLMLSSSNNFPLREYTALYVNPNVTEPHIDSVYPELVFPGDTVNLLIKTKNIVIDTTAWLGLFVDRVNTLTGTLRLGGQAMLLDSNTIQVKIIIPMNAKSSDCDLYLYYNKELLKEYSRLTVQSQNQTSVGVLSSIDLNNEFTLYPNPVKDILNIKSTKKVNTVKIINSIGQVSIVSGENMIRQTDGISIDVKSLNLTSGVYYLYLSAGEEFIYRRIIIE